MEAAVDVDKAEFLFVEKNLTLRTVARRLGHTLAHVRSALLGAGLEVEGEAPEGCESSYTAKAQSLAKEIYLARK